MTSCSPTVSVVIPAYNAEPFIGAAIESIVNQCYPNMEIIVVDDGSTDRTAEIAQRFGVVRCVRQPNRGISAARNTGIQASHGEVLGFLDADDLWSDGKLDRQLRALAESPAGRIIAGKVEQFVQPGYENREPSRTQMSSAYTAGAMLIRKAEFLKVGPFDESLRIGEFMDWLSRATRLGFTEHVLDTVVLRRRIHGRNTTTLQRKSNADYLTVLKAHLDRNRKAS